MKARLLILLTGLSLMLVACKDNKEAKVYLARCAADQTACAALYRSAATQVAGSAATSGKPQVAAAGSTVQTGQVPSTSILPASTTDAQVKEQSIKIQSALDQYEQTGSLTGGTSSGTGTGTATVATTSNTTSSITSTTTKPSSFKPASASAEHETEAARQPSNSEPSSAEESDTPSAVR